jgi:hypothetical protein
VRFISIYAISGHHSNEVTNDKTLYECKLYILLRINYQYFVSVYRVYSVNINKIFMRVYIFSILNRRDDLGLNICACCA